MVKSIVSDALYQAFLYIDIDQDDIYSDLLDVTDADDILVIPAKNSPDLTWAGNDDMGDMAGADIEFDVADKP